MSFSRSHSHLNFFYLFNDSLTNRVEIFNDLGIFYFPTLSFELQINNVVNKTLKVLGFIKRNTSSFLFISCLCTPYFFLVRSILDYEMIAWHPYLACDELRIDYIQNLLLSYAAFLLKIKHSNHDYSTLRSTLNIPILSSYRIDADISFITSIINGSLDSPKLLSSIPFHVPSNKTRDLIFFKFPALSNFLRP